MTIKVQTEKLLEEIAKAADLAQLDSLRVSALGKKGFVALEMAGLGKIEPAARASEGAKLNQYKTKITSALKAQKTLLEQNALNQELQKEKIDISLTNPKPPAMLGRLHPVWFVMDEVADIFTRLGFAFETGPDIESEYYNFTALNIDENHPARASHDSFFFPSNDANNDERQNFCLRTHTSPVQIRVMEKSQPPLRFIAPGRVYRCDLDQTHTPMFHQIEGVAIDKQIHLGHLKWLLLHFLRKFFENDEVEIRLRPHFFPFTEPSLEVDMRNDKNSNWLEIAGCGLIHPKVLSRCEIDPEIFQGFAFGFGIDRLAMLKYGISDLRQFFENDLAWLRHYGFSIGDEVR